MKYKACLAILLAAAMLTGCATAYGPRGSTTGGGYEEQQLDNTSYRVSFYGNGDTSRDMVWNYWIYRCAELTKLKGFDLFYPILDKKKTGAIPGGGALRPANLQSGDEGTAVKTAGGYRPPTYYYSPGYTTTITTYSASAVVKMYRNPLPADVKFALNAQSVLDSLKPYVQSAGKEPAPKREEVISKATTKVP
jgi:hypothetical protein